MRMIKTSEDNIIFTIGKVANSYSLSRSLRILSILSLALMKRLDMVTVMVTVTDMDIIIT